jgi:ribulose-5-phosphate 4-epimerase/fuculose-1-phosphate aldolase
MVGQRRAVPRDQSGGVCFRVRSGAFQKFCILRNHGLLTVGRSVEESVGWFVMAERVAEVHVKAPNARPISDEAAAAAASTLAPHPVGWRMFQWLQRSLVPHRSVVD